MNDISYFSTSRIIEILINKGHEGEYWDYKQEWHINMEDLLKDIICDHKMPEFYAYAMTNESTFYEIVQI